MHDRTEKYRGRFAPSPTGPLHFGSLVAAVGSCLEARIRGGEWLVRMDDLDRQREAPGAADAILRALEAYGFEWDGEVVFQSRRGDAYGAALVRLEDQQAVFRCACTRREILDSALSIVGEPVYPGTCRSGVPQGREARTTRVRVGNAAITFDDLVQGTIGQHLGREVGDFVVRRADGYFAYQLAVVVDDFEQGITHVVRGADLLASTPRQIFLQRLLSFPTLQYSHLPVAVNRDGEKLSKQTLAAPVLERDAPAELVRALRFLGQSTPSDLAGASVPEIWSWARKNWRAEDIPRRSSLPAHEAC